MRYEDVLTSLRAAYDAQASRRSAAGKAEWKVAERSAFADRLRTAGATRLLEIGAGPGVDAAFFAAAGLTVTATDLSPQMVHHCRQRGLDAHVMDFMRLDFPPATFDAVYALNCLLHVPDADLPAVLSSVYRLIRPGGLFFMGVYGVADGGGEGIAEWDDSDPPRFFAWRSDEQIQHYVVDAGFIITDFHVRLGGPDRFQSLTLTRPIDR